MRPCVGSYLWTGRGTAALRHCDGSDLLSRRMQSMVRIDAPERTGSAIDWNGERVHRSWTQVLRWTSTSTAAPTVCRLARRFRRLDEHPSEPARRPPQHGGLVRRRQRAAISSWGRCRSIPAAATSGVATWAAGTWAVATWAAGTSGAATWAAGTSGAATWAAATWAAATSGVATWAAGTCGDGDLFVGNPYPEGELDSETAGDLARTPPNEFTACVIGVNCSGVTSPPRGVFTCWTAPNVGGVSEYSVYRVPGATLLPDAPWEPGGGGPVRVVPGAVLPGRCARPERDGLHLLRGRDLRRRDQERPVQSRDDYDA